MTKKLTVKKVIILGGNGNATKFLYHFLAKRINIEKVILEQPVARGLFLKGGIKGIDTGAILAQAPISMGPQDNFVTYPYLQLAKGLCILNDLLPMFYSGRVVTLEAPDGRSTLWSHPTLIEYFVNRVKAKVK